MDGITPSDGLVEQADTNPASGLLSVLNNYMGGQIASNTAIKQKQAESDIDQNKETAVYDHEHPKGIPAYLNADLAEKALPGYGGKMVAEYNQKNPNSPLTMDQGLDYITKAQTLLSNNSPDTTKEDAKQNALEKQAMDRLTSVRGDQSLMRTEAQRDAAGLAYDTIAKAQSEKRDLSQTEYTDVLGQLWKVRTGASPTEQVLKDLETKTAKQGINRVITYASGDPNLVGATTKETLDNLKQFVVSSGKKADQQWDSYMAPRMIKPTGLEQSRWDHIMAQHRGIRFEEQQNVSDKTYANGATKTVDIEAKKAALRTKIAQMQ